MNTNVFFQNALEVLNKIANNCGSVPSNVAVKDDTDAIKTSIDNLSEQIGEVNSRLDDINGEIV